jgi:tRNA1(Val) A37 N6-methylase TrmN6
MAGAASRLTRDGLLGGRITIAQPASGYRAGTDSLLLAAAVPARPGERVLEAGIGTGAAALALLSRVPDCRVVGIESETGHAELARGNAAGNAFADRLDVICCDISNATVDHLKSRGVPAGFAHAMANPPYYEKGRARAPADASRRAAHIGEAGALALWVARLGAAVRGAGTVTVIHRAAMLGELMAAMRRHVGGPVVLPIAAHAGDDATRIIVQARKGARSPVRLMAPLVLHLDDGAYGPQAELVLRAGAGLDLSAQPAAIVTGEGSAA